MEEHIAYRLEHLISEHRELDLQIEALMAEHTIDQLQVQRLKRKKLSLKDEIIKLQSTLQPDLIA